MLTRGRPLTRSRISTKRINVSLYSGVIFEVHRRQHALVALALELIQPRPVFAEALPAKEPAFHFIALVSQHDSWVSRRRAPPFWNQRSDNRRRFPRARNIREHVRIWATGRERSV